MGKLVSDRPRIALIVDNPFRDLPGLVLVAWRLCQADVACYLVPMNLQIREVLSLSPDFVLLNYLRTNNEAWARKLLNAGIHIGVLDTEGSVFTLMSNAPTAASSHDDARSAMDEYALTMARDAQVRYQVARFCAWTPTFADYACRAGWYRPEQVVVTGPPRMDYYAHPWREAALRMSAYADAYAPPLILIAGSFPMVNPQFQSPERELELMSTQFTYDRDLMKQRQQVEMEGLRGLAAIANNLARRFPHATVIYRPHPFEGEAIYRDLLEPLSNLHLVKQGTVNAWLLRAAIMVSLGSSTAIEAGLAGVPALTPGWLSTYLPVPMVEAVSVSCATPESLAEQTEAVLAGRFIPPPEIAANIQQVIANTFYKIDGRSHERTAEAIRMILDGHRVSLDKCRYMAYGFDRDDWRWQVHARLSQVAGRSVYWSLLHVWERWFKRTLPWDNSAKRFDTVDVQQMIDAIEAIAPPLSRKVMVAPAESTQEYHFGYRQGRSVVLRPAARNKIGN